MKPDAWCPHRESDRGRTSPFRGEGRKVWNRRNLATRTRPGERPESKPTAAAQSSPRERLFLPLCRPSHPRLDELGDFGDLVADFAALAAAGLWQVHVGSLPRTCSGLRLQKRAVLLAGGDRGGGLFNDTHRRHHGPRPKAHPPNTDAREIRDFGNTLRHHDVDRQRRE
jgi:hypothetical protein